MVGEDDAVCVGVWPDGGVGIVCVCVSETEVLNESELLGEEEFILNDGIMMRSSCNDNDNLQH